MTISNFNESLKKRTTEYFVSEHFSEEATNPENWVQEPSNYGVKNAKIVTEKHMMAFDDFTGGIENLGRDEIDYNAVDALEACIKDTDTGHLTGIKGTKGVTDNGRLLYYNVETGKKLNGIKRSIVGSRLGIKGWMSVGVRFEGNTPEEIETAESDFSYWSNNPEENDSQLVHQLPTKGDTIAYVIDRFQKTGRDDISEKEITELVYNCTKKNYPITSANKGDIIKKVLVKLQSKGKSSERYIVYDDKEIRKELDALVKCGNEWALEFWEDYDEDQLESNNVVIIFINMNGNGISGAYQYIERKLKFAKEKKKPVCYVLVAKPPRAKNTTLTSRRATILTGTIRSLEEDICGCLGLPWDNFKDNIPHNHPDSRHVFLRQDSENEPEGTLIYAKDIL